MNILVDDRIAGTDDFAYQFVAPTGFGPSNPGEGPAPRLSREQLAAFWAAESDNARSGHFSVPSAEPAGVTAEKGLAAGVLKQAARDLRRFRGATKGVKRELYDDAYSWITAYDFSWAYSFMNVCKLLGVCPEAVRAEVLTDASLSWLDYWTQRAGRISHTLRSSFARAFAGGNAPEKAEATQLAAI
jgi:hypothetical protein